MQRRRNATRDPAQGDAAKRRFTFRSSMTHSAYTPRRPSRSTFLDVRGLRYHLRSWGEVADPALVLLHGGQDGSATFQFLVDAFQRGWHVMAPDWRGHGLSDRAPQGYWF